MRRGARARVRCCVLLGNALICRTLLKRMPATLDEPVDKRQRRCDPPQAANDVRNDKSMLHMRGTKDPKNGKPCEPKQLRSELATKRPETRTKGLGGAIEAARGRPKDQSTEEPNGRHRIKCLISEHGRSALPNVRVVAR
jgi:hypothetical protein